MARSTKAFNCAGLLAGALLMWGGDASAQLLDPAGLGIKDDQIVAQRGDATITVAEVKAKIRTLPPELRDNYINDPGRLSKMLDSMLLIDQTAVEARAQGHDQGMNFAHDLELAKTELLSRQQIERRVEALEKPNFERLAHEQYLADPKPYTLPPEIDVRHALIATDGREEDEARRLAEELHGRAQNGEDFAVLVAEYSDDDALKARGGLLTKIDVKKLDLEFAKAVLRLEKPGDISPAVRSKFGYHVIKLERKTQESVQPFEVVKGQIIRRLEADYVESEKARYLRTFSEQPLDINGELIRQLTEAPPGSLSK